MILINLLPDEFREKKRTPVKLLLTITASVAINGSLAAYWAWTAFGVAAEVKSELAVLQDQKAAIDPQVSYHNELVKESQLFDAREEMLKKITANRISWTRKLDELIDVVNVGGDGEKYLVWFDDLTVDQKESARQKSFGSLKASGHSGSTSFAHVANFLDDLERSTFCEDFNRPAPPEGSQSSKDEGLMPSEIFNFPLEATLKAPEERRRGPDGKLLPVDKTKSEKSKPERASKTKSGGKKP
jgi:Tfp pilus assembly protein PilN